MDCWAEWRNNLRVFTIDVSRCNGCYNCQIVCKDEHAGNDWTPYAKPQPEVGQFWLKLNENVRGTVPKVKVAYFPTLCNHCRSAPCIAACPEHTIYRREDGLVIIDPVKCTGCKDCVGACPYGAIYFNDSLNIAQKCTGCAHLLDSGWKVPRCVDACPTEALEFVEESRAGEFVKDAEFVIPERKELDQPRVYYHNLPKKFITGTVYDPVEKEVITGAKVTLTEWGTKVIRSIRTDNYGDFWFEKLNTAKFDLEIESGGRLKRFEALSTEKDVNLGDIPLS